MAKCLICKKETLKTVYEPNVHEMVPLCDECKEKEFSKCIVCGQYYLNNEIVNGVCEACRAGKEQI